MNKLRLRRVTYLARGHTARKKQNQDLNSLETTLATLVNASLQGSLPSLSSPSPKWEVGRWLRWKLDHVTSWTPFTCQEVPQLLDQSFKTPLGLMPA